MTSDQLIPTQESDDSPALANDSQEQLLTDPDFRLYRINEQLQARIATLSQECQSLGEQNVELAIQLSEADSDRASLALVQQELARAQEQIQTQDAELEELRPQVAALDQTLQQLRTKQILLEQVQQQCNQLQQECEQQKQDIADLQRQLANAEDMAQRHKQALATFKQRYLERAVSGEMPSVSAVSAPAQNDSFEKLRRILEKTLGITGKVVLERTCKSKAIDSSKAHELSFAALAELIADLRKVAERLCRDAATRDTLDAKLDELLSTAQANGKSSHTTANSEATADELANTSPSRPQYSNDAKPELPESEPSLAAGQPEASAVQEFATNDPKVVAAPVETSNLEPTAALPAEVQAQSIETETAPAQAQTSLESTPSEENEPIAEFVDEQTLDSNEPSELVDTAIPNKHMHSELWPVASEQLNKILAKPQDHLTNIQDPTAVLNQAMWDFGKLVAQQRPWAKADTIEKMSGQLVSDAIDDDLAKAVTWLKHLASWRGLETTSGANEQLDSLVITENSAGAKAATGLAKVINATLTQIADLNIKFTKGGSLVGHQCHPTPVLYLDSELLQMPAPQQVFVIAHELLSLQLYHQDTLFAVEQLLQSEDSAAALATNLIKRVVSTAIEQGHQFLPDVLGETSSLWGEETIDELADLLQRCYDCSHFLEFRYIQELITAPKPFVQSMNLEADIFALKLCNVADASLAIIHQLLGPEVAAECAKRGLQLAWNQAATEQNSVRQRLRNLWCYYLLR